MAISKLAAQYANEQAALIDPTIYNDPATYQVGTADYKGASILFAAFFGRQLAQEWIDACKRELEGLGGDLQSSILKTDAHPGWAHGWDVAVVMGVDIVHQSQIEEDGVVNWDLGLYGLSVHPTPPEILSANMSVERPATRRQVAFLAALCARRGITEADLIRLGIEQKRLHPSRAELIQQGRGGSLADLTISEIGGLFAFRDFLEGKIQ